MKSLNESSESTSAPSMPIKDTNIVTTKTPRDVESNPPRPNETEKPDNVSAFKSLGLLDRFLAVWILLAMVIGIILGNFVPSIESVLDKGKFVGVSVPIGISPNPPQSLPANDWYQLSACSS
jgi:ACR3 family arsenite transporter